MNQQLYKIETSIDILNCRPRTQTARCIVLLLKAHASKQRPQPCSCISTAASNLLCALCHCCEQEPRQQRHFIKHLSSKSYRREGREGGTYISALHGWDSRSVWWQIHMLQESLESPAVGYGAGVFEPGAMIACIDAKEHREEFAGDVEHVRR